MTLETILKPVKAVDEEVLRQYTKIGKKLKLDEEKKRYWVGFGLWNATSFFCAHQSSQVFGFDDFYARLIYCLPDGYYNLAGMIIDAEKKETREEKALNLLLYPFKKFNSALRLPTFLTGLGFVGKFGVDLYNHVTNGQPLDSHSYAYLEYGTGMLSLASSMYIKEMDPKLLNKVPFWKKAYNSIKDKIKSIAPTPVPQLAPAVSNMDAFKMYQGVK